MTAPDQGKLDAYAEQIAVTVLTHGLAGTETMANALVNGPSYTADKVAGYPIKSQVDGQTYPLMDFLVSIDRKLSEVLTALAAQAPKVTP